MLYKVLVTFHLLGATVWIGGHIVLVAMVLPPALRNNEPERVLEFERGYGRLGLAALITQLVTGLWLSHLWVRDWSTIFTEPTPQAHLVLTKLALLILTVALGGYTYHRVITRLPERGLKAFAVLSSAATALAIALLIVGVKIRTGG